MTLNYHNVKQVQGKENFRELIGSIVIDYEKCLYAFSLIVNCVSNSTKGDIIYKKKCSSKEKISEYRSKIKLMPSVALKLKSLKLLAELGEIRERRNHLVHSVWYSVLSDKDTINQIFLKNNKQRVLIERNFDSKEAKEIVQHLTWLTFDIHMHLHDCIKWNIKRHPKKYGIVSSSWSS